MIADMASTVLKRVSEKTNTPYKRRCSCVPPGTDPSIDLPGAGSTVRFESAERTQKSHVVVYADFKCLTGAEKDEAWPYMHHSTTYAVEYRNHTTCGYWITVLHSKK